METAVIAGVGPGLGASLARAFSKEGFSVALLSRRQETSEPVAAQIKADKGTALALCVDVTDRDAVFRTVETIRAELSPITTLAYNASGFGRGNFLDLDPAIIRQSFEVGTMGAVHLAQAIIPDMLRAGHGFISLTGATASLRGRAGQADTRRQQRQQQRHNQRTCVELVTHQICLLGGLCVSWGTARVGGASSDSPPNRSHQLQTTPITATSSRKKLPARGRNPESRNKKYQSRVDANS